MKNDIERSPRVMVGGAESMGDLFGRAAARLQSWLLGSDQEPMGQELTPRLEERQKERDRIARELHVEQVPVDSPGKPSP